MNSGLRAIHGLTFEQIYNYLQRFVPSVCHGRWLQQKLGGVAANLAYAFANRSIISRVALSSMGAPRSLRIAKGMRGTDACSYLD